MKKKRAFSLIELVMVILIVGVIAAVGSYLLIFVIQHAMYTPNKMNTGMIAEDAINKIIDGDSLAKGLRFSRQISAVSPTSITFMDQDGKTVIFTLSSNKITRTINAVADNAFLYYAASPSIIIAVGSSGALFSYYDSAGNVTATAANVRRVDINLAVRTGTGSFGQWQGQTERTSSIRVPKFQ